MKMGAKVEKIYGEAMARAWKKNIRDVRKDPISEDKVYNWAVARGLDVEEALKKFKKDDYFAAVFAKDPSRQSLHQSAAADYISGLEDVHGFRMLPAAGRNALYVVDGRVTSEHPTSIKSIDFKFEWVDKDGNPYTAYASHKHTDQEGGSQDNQYHDLMQFISEAQACTSDERVIFLAVADGPYYERPERQAPNGRSRLEYLADTGNRHVSACASDGLLDKLTELAAHWND